MWRIDKFLLQKTKRSWSFVGGSSTVLNTLKNQKWCLFQQNLSTWSFDCYLQDLQYAHWLGCFADIRRKRKGWRWSDATGDGDQWGVCKIARVGSWRAPDHFYLMVARKLCCWHFVLANSGCFCWGKIFVIMTVYLVSKIFFPVWLPRNS
jgi:hypothetical protein